MITVTSKDFEVTDAMKEEIRQVEASLSKHISGEASVRLTLSKAAPDVFHIHMQTHYLGDDIISDHESHNYHKALDLCKDHLIKQLDKRREKVQKKG